MPAPTLRTLAKTLGLSRTTVSEALRGSSCVKPATAERIRQAAAEVGYKPNPLAGAVMSELRRSRGNSFRGVIAMLSLNEADIPTHAKTYHQELLRGSSARAEELGFKVEHFHAGGPKGLSIHRLDQILQSRGIQGIVVMPSWDTPDLDSLDWTQYAGVYTDYMIERPALHSVCPDHHRSLTTALAQALELGYKRPGLFIQHHIDERLQYRWIGAFLAYQHSLSIGNVPLLMEKDITQENFTQWFKTHKPDVVLGHNSEAVDWMRASGAKIPQKTGFICLNILRAHTPCAGLDQRPALIGARAIEVIIAKLHRNERGAPQPTALTTISARWVDGPTLRSRKSS